MTKNVFGWHYPPGAEHDPNAPWNQVDPTESDAFMEMNESMTLERMQDTGGWFLESISQENIQTLKRMSEHMQAMVKSGDDSEASMAYIGRMVWCMVESYCTPDVDEVVEQLEAMNELGDPRC